jgi:hypothetical protein
MLGWMRRYFGIGVAWVGATVLSVVIASAAVAGIRDRVVETPVAIGLPTTTVTTTTTGSVATEPPSSIPEITVATTATVATSAGPPTTEPPTTEPPPTPETTVVTPTTAPPATTTTTTTTTTAPPQTTTTQALSYETVDLVGGTVTLSYGNGEIRVVSAVPRPGFSYEAEDTVGIEIEVKFISNDHKSKLEAHLDSGELKIDKEEESHGDDD